MSTLEELLQKAETDEVIPWIQRIQDPSVLNQAIEMEEAGQNRAVVIAAINAMFDALAAAEAQARQELADKALAVLRNGRQALERILAWRRYFELLAQDGRGTAALHAEADQWAHQQQSRILFKAQKLYDQKEYEPCITAVRGVLDTETFKEANESGLRAMKFVKAELQQAHPAQVQALLRGYRKKLDELAARLQQQVSDKEKLIETVMMASDNQRTELEALGLVELRIRAQGAIAFLARQVEKDVMNAIR